MVDELASTCLASRLSVPAECSSAANVDLVKSESGMGSVGTAGACAAS